VQNQMSDLQERLGVRTVLQASLKGVARGIINPGEICRARGIEDPASVITQLSDREIQLLETMSLDGGAKSSLKEVGKQLGISVHTVRNHLTRIYNTTGVRDEVFAVMLYLAAKEQPIIPAHPKGV
ncbi:MAG: helix-turn-helix transcriptional regulator, partial [Candidatus Aenigmarchaeota archaeon]|nr:helix-turn-helix transcriptional regulator [Candidatus Aenigmarchaeota archaeon]